MEPKHSESTRSSRVQHPPNSRLHFLPQGGEGREGLAMQGVVKLYDPVTGTGVVLTEADQQEVYLRPGSLEGSLFRMLRQGQRILFDTVEEDGNTFVVGVHLGTEHS